MGITATGSLPATIMPRMFPACLATAAAAPTPTTNGSEAAGNAYQLRTRSSSLRTAWVEMDGEEEEEKAAAAMAAALSSDSEGKPSRTLLGA